jgi:peptidoglycan/LPS O-acetylase OafA/YrhL
MIKKIDFLDSFRGLLAVSVVFDHLLRLSAYLIWPQPVINFFLLSSFLLTYRLMKQFEKVTDSKEIFRISINYFIMRTFRIYIPYVLFAIINRWLEILISSEEPQPTFFTLISLSCYLGERSTGSHLWTMPAEIRFYFVIPLVAFVASKIKSVRSITLICTLFVGFLVLIKPLNLLTVGEPWINVNLKAFFPIFFLGKF